MKKILMSSMFALGLAGSVLDVVNSKGDGSESSANLENMLSNNYSTNSLSYGDDYYIDNIESIKKKLPEYRIHRIDSTLRRPRLPDENKFDHLLETMLAYQNLPELLILYTKANARQESTMVRKNGRGRKVITYFDPTAVSRTGARGLLQFTRKSWSAYGGNDFYDAFDPQKNLESGAKFTVWLWDHLSSRVPGWDNKSDRDKLAYMAAAHNGGTGALRRAGYNINKMRYESRNHAKKVTRYYDIYKAEKKIIKEYSSLRDYNDL